MQNDELNAVDERLLDELIAVEEGRVPAAVTPPLRAALSCVDMLRQVWPGHAPVADDAAPDFLGRFRVVRKLGEGGGGIVFLAHDPVLKREIAVKVPRPEALLTPDLRQRFLREARAAAALNHPHVVRVLEAGDIGLVCFIANEYCPGADLKTWLKGWRHPENATVWDLPIPAAVRLVATLADAVDYTHRQGILHRDLKPSNVLLTPLNAGADPCAIASLDELVPRISDFGLAKIADAEASRHGATKTGMVFGTPQYMAPEQAQGRATELGAAVDVYALGVILYELLTGRPPFQADTDVDLLYRVIHDEPPTPSSLRPVIHRDLETICLKCLRKDPTQRYASAGDLARDLRDFLAGVPIQARRLPWWRRAHLWSRRHPARALAALLGVALTGLLGGLTWYQWRLDESETRRRESEKGAGLAVSARDAAEHARRSAEEAANTHKYFATVSRVEELVARRKIGWRSECLRLLKEASALDIESRDPLALRGAACRVLAGVDLVEQGHVPLLFRPHRIAYLPGGKKLAVAQSRSFPLLPCSVLVLDSETGKIERSLRFPPQAILEGGGLVPDGARCLAVSRDGRRLAIGVRSGLIHVWDLHAPGDAPALSWTVANGPVGRVLFAGDNTLLTASDANRLVQSWRLEPAAATEQARVEIRPGRLGIDLNPVQDLLACIASGDRVLFLDPQTLKPARPPLMTRADAFRFHPLDGVAAIARDGRLLLIDWHSGRLVRRLPARELAIAHDGPLEDLLFSSDGTLMISSCSSEEDRRIKIWKVATGECLTVLSAGASGPLPVAWCNASACLAAGVGDDVKTYRLLGQREERCSALLPHPLQALRYRPDGKALATAGSHHALSDLNDTGARAHEQPSESFIALWDDEGRNVRSLSPRSDGRGPHRCALAFHPGDHSLIARFSSATSFLDKDGAPLPRRPVKEAEVWAFDATGASLWGFGPDTWMRSWTWPECNAGPAWDNRLARVVTGKSQIYALAVGRDRVLGGGRDGQVRVLRRADAALEKVVAPMGLPIRAICFCKDERRAIVTSQKGEVRLIAVPEGTTLDSHEDHADAVECLALDGAGRLLATGGRDGAVHLYRITGDTLKLVLSLATPAPVLAVDFHPDGTRLALAVQGELAARVWRLDRLREELRGLGLDGDDW